MKDQREINEQVKLSKQLAAAEDAVIEAFFDGFTAGRRIEESDTGENLAAVLIHASHSVMQAKAGNLIDALRQVELLRNGLRNEIKRRREKLMEETEGAARSVT